MSTYASHRKRVASEPVAGTFSEASGTVAALAGPKVEATNRQTGAISRIMAGLFGTGNPRDNSSDQVVVPKSRTGYYHFHEGDVFTPGTQNYVFEPATENPVQTIWGRGFLYPATPWPVEQEPQVMSYPTVQINGIGGVVAGQFVGQGTEESDF